MCDQTEIVYEDGEVVWVKLGPTWWPGQVLDREKAPPDAISSFRKPPIAVVKFFKEELFEFVRSYNQIYKYNCSRKHEFIKKGLDQYRAKHPHMELFPSYVCEAEVLTHGDPDIIHAEEFKPVQKLDYNSIFSSGNEKKTKPKLTPTRIEDRTPKITHPRIIQKYLKGTSDYKVHILVQETRKDDGETEEKIQLEAEEESMIPPPTPTPPRTPATPGPLACHACPFTCNRITVMVLHNKTHSAGYLPYTPPKRPKIRLPHSTPKIKLSPKCRTFKKSRGRPKKITLPESSVTSVPLKPVKSSVKSSSGPVKRKAKEKETEKPKTDVEIKNSLLADWSESSNDSFDILSSVNLCEKPKPAVSPSRSPKAEKVDDNKSTPEETEDTLCSKPLETKKTDCFDFDDDDDDELAIQAIGRKIPRLSTKSDDTTVKLLDPNVDLVDSNKKLLSPEDEKMEVDLDSKINDLLQETKLPDLPSLPTDPKFIETKSSLKDDDVDNDKKDVVKPQQKTIFKTKTFFSSRHSRSQDAIEKYVADNTSVDKPPTYMEEAEQPENPSDVSPVLTPPSKGSQNKAPKCAPKILFKKLKAALSEQIKPQASMSTEDKWDNDSLDKLINTSSVESGVESKCSTVNDLLGTVEEPLVVSGQDKSPPVEEVSKPLDNSGIGIRIVSDPNKQETKMVIDDESVNVTQNIGSLNNTDRNKINVTDSDHDQVSSSSIQKESQSVSSPKSCVVEPKVVKILSPSRKSERKLPFSKDFLTSVPGDPVNSSIESPEKLDPIVTNITKSPRKINISKDLKIIKTVQSDAMPICISKQEETMVNQAVISNDLVATSEHDLPSNIQNSNNSFDQESVIIEVKGSNSFDIAPIEMDKTPTESDLQIAETLINLPTSGAVTPMEFSHGIDDIKMSESDKNISAAKSLVQMSEAIQHEHSLLVTADTIPKVLHRKLGHNPMSTTKQNLPKPTPTIVYKDKPIENTKLFKILDEPAKPKPAVKIINTKASDVLNFQLGSQPLTKHRVIIRKGAPQKETKQPTLLSSPIKSIQPKEDEALFDINSMPIVLSEEILTPENIQKMPIVVSDVQITPKIDTPPTITEKIVMKEPVMTSVVSSNESIITSTVKKYGAGAITTPVVKTTPEKSSTPNILSKSNKVKTVKHLLVVDKNSGEQKIITSESYEDPPPVAITKVIKRSPAILSRSQKPGEKFIILPTTQSAKPTSTPPALTIFSGTSPKVTPTVTKPSPSKRTQKIILNPQTGSQMLLEDSALNDRPKTTTKAKIIQNRTSSEPMGNAVMIITNAQGVQSKIVLTPEHQKVLFSKKPGHLTLTTQSTPQVKSVANVPPPRAKPIAVTSQSIITSRGQIMNPISGNALITSTGQLLPAQLTVTSSTPATSSKQKGSIISSTKVIPPRERVIISGKPNQTILTSKGQLIMTQMAPTTIQSKISSNTTKLSTTTITSSQITMSPGTQKTIIGKPKQTITKMTSPTIIKSNSKFISGDLATLLQGKKPGTVMHLSAAQFEHLQKTGQIIQQPPLTQIVQTQKGKPSTTKVQSQKIIVQKQAPTASPKQITSPIIERKIQPVSTPRTMPSLIQTKTTTPPPPKKQKLKELLSTKVETNQAKKKKPMMTYASPAKPVVEQPKSVEQVMDLGNLDDLIPATTIATRKGEVRVSDSPQVPAPMTVSEPPSTSNVKEQSIVQEQSIPSTSMQAQEPIQGDTTQQGTGGLGDGQLLAVPGENFGGPANSFYLCVEENGTLTPIDNQPLVLENNQLVPMVMPPVLPEFLNTEEQILVDQQTLLSLLGGNGGDRLVTGENQQLLLQGDVRQLMAALTPQAAPNQDILAAALADTDVFQQDTLVPEGLVVSGGAQTMLVEMDALGSDFQNLNSAVTVHSNVSETSTTLKQPIMSPVEIPSKKRLADDMPNTESLEDSLAVIGVTPPSVPTSLDLPITVTDPRIAPKTTNPLSLSCGPLYAPPTLVLSPTPTTLDVFPSSLLTEHKNVALTSSSICSTVTQSTQDIMATKTDITAFHSMDKMQGNKKQPASSMPCLDDSSSDSFASDNPQQLTEAIQTKTYSPISMPLLTEDPPLPPDNVSVEDTTSVPPQEVKSMPVLLDTEEITSSGQDSSVVDANMPLLDDTREDAQDNNISSQETKVENSNVMTIPNSIALPHDIFNESSATNENQEQSSGEDHAEEPLSTTEEVIHSDGVQQDGDVMQSGLPAENVPVPMVDVPEDLMVGDVPIETMTDVQGEPVDGIPIIVTTEDGEPGGAVVDVDLDVAPPSVPSPPEGNSLPHTEGEEPFSDASSDVSTEIPLQPPISVSHHSLSAERNGDHDKRTLSPDSMDSSPKRFRYDDER